MKKIVLTAAALLAISGSAFAGSDRAGSSQYDTTINKAATSVDNTQTSSVRDTGSVVYKLLNSSGNTQKQQVFPGSDRNLFGR